MRRGVRRVVLAGSAGAVLAAAPAAVAPVASARPICDEGWVFANPHRYARRLVVFDRERDENRTGHRIRATLIAKRGGTARWHIDAAIDAGAGGSIFKVIKASVSSHFHVSVTRKMTASIGNKVSSPVRAHHALVGKYGVFRMVVTGHLYYWTRYCGVGTDKGYVTVKLPDEVGWRVTEPHL
jgi:hypothetical protein